MKTSKKYTAIIDIESTCWEGHGAEARKPQMETIEIGVAMFNEETKEIQARASFFIKPMLVDELSDFCTKLTSIKYDDCLKNAHGFPVVWLNFIDWCRNRSEDELPVFACWGRFDNDRLRNDCGRFKRTLWEPNWDSFINIKQKLVDRHGFKRCSVEKALRVLNMPFEGTPHRGIDDAYNIAKIYQFLRVRENGEIKTD